MYRLRLVLVRASQWKVLAKHADVIVAAIAKKNPLVPLQLYDRRQYGANIPWHHARSGGMLKMIVGCLPLL